LTLVDLVTRRRRPSATVHAVLLICAGAAAIPAAASAHGVAGQRFFPTTFAVDDPFMNDELSLLVHTARMSGETEGSRVRTTSLELGFSKRILPRFGLELEEEYDWLHTIGDGTGSGFGNLTATLKYQFVTSGEHELLLSAGVSDEIGGTGSSGVGAESFSTVSPTLYFGKGLGDLPDSLELLRPLAITGVLSSSFPTEQMTEGAENPATLTWAFTVQYSLMYLQSAVKDVGLGAPFNRLVPMIEIPLETCLDAGCGGQTTWSVNPGVAWIGRYFELGAAAEIPVSSGPGSDVGVFVLVHLFVDDLFPGSIGRPLFP
jgi:hypothetical protein